MIVTKEMVDRFLMWPLPESVCSDHCATMRGYTERTGTNLLTADEARQMLEHVLAAMPDYCAALETALQITIEEGGDEWVLKSFAIDLEARIHQFDAAICRVAHHVGAVCGGVDTGPNGGHTAEEIIRCIDKKIEAHRFALNDLSGWAQKIFRELLALELRLLKQPTYNCGCTHLCDKNPDCPGVKYDPAFPYKHIGSDGREYAASDSGAKVSATTNDAARGGRGT